MEPTEFVVVIEEFEDGVPREAFHINLSTRSTEHLRIFVLPVLQDAGTGFPFKAITCLN